jgi:hypothetical protein
LGTKFALAVEVENASCAPTSACQARRRTDPCVATKLGAPARSRRRAGPPGDYCAARSAKRELLRRLGRIDDDATHPEETSWQLLSIGKSRVRHGADADGRPLCERGKWAQTPGTVKPAGQGQPRASCAAGSSTGAGRPLREAGMRPTRALVGRVSRGGRGCQPAECPGLRVGRSAAAKRSTIAAAGSTASIAPTPCPAYIAIASTSPLVLESGTLTA